jgi:hypothetical protein
MKPACDVPPSERAGATIEETMMLVQTQTKTRVSGRDRRFFVGMAVAAMMTVFFGFAPSYYFRSFIHIAEYPTGVSVSPSVAPLVHAHAIAFSGWILLFLVQSTLIAAGRADVHRRLGVAGAVLAAFMIVLGLMTAVRGARDGWNPGGPYPDSLAFMIVGFVDILVFAGFAAAGLYFRRRPELHKRLMLLATVGGLMWPAITRMPYVAGRPVLMFGLLGALVLAPVGRDLLRRSGVHPVSLWGGLIVLGAFPIRVAIGLTDSWHAFAAWLIR